MESGGGNSETRVPIMNEDCQPETSSAAITSPPSVVESQHAYNQEHSTFASICKPDLSVSTVNENSPSSSTSAKINDNNNNNKLILEKVSDQIQSFEFSNESNVAFSSLTWQPASKAVYLCESSNLVKESQVSEPIQASSSSSSSANVLVSESNQADYTTSQSKNDSNLSPVTVPYVKSDPIQCCERKLSADVGQQPSADASNQANQVENKESVDNHSVNATNVYPKEVPYEHELTDHTTNYSLLGAASSFSEQHHAESQLMAPKHYQNVASHEHENQNFNECYIKEYQPPNNESIQELKAVDVRIYEKESSVEEGQSTLVVASATESIHLHENLTGQPGKSEIILQVEASEKSTVNDKNHDLNKKNHRCTNEEIISEIREGSHQNATVMLLSEDQIHESNICGSNQPENTLNITPTHYTISQQQPNQLLTLESPMHNVMSSSDLSAIHQNQSGSLQVYSSDILSADLSNVQSSKDFGSGHVTIIKTEPCFSESPTSTTSVPQTSTEALIPTISIKQEPPNIINESEISKNGSKVNMEYMEMRTTQLPSLSTLPPFSSTGHGLSFNPTQLHIMSHSRITEECPVSDANRMPLVLSSNLPTSNQTTILPSLFTMSNHSNATTLTTLTQAALPHCTDDVENAVVAPLLSMSSTSLAALAPSMNAEQQPYLLIPVSGNQQLLAFASTLPDASSLCATNTGVASQPNTVLGSASVKTWPITAVGSSDISSEGDTVKVEFTVPQNKPPVPKSHACNLCGKSFASRAVHNLHMRSHSGEKPYPCSVCGRHFSQKTSLTRHMRSHTGERPYPCHVCGKRFSDKERVKIHMRSHTGEKPFPCSICGKHFSQKSTVKRHMSVHTGERPYKCDACGKGFANRGNLNSHVRTHSSSH